MVWFGVTLFMISLCGLVGVYAWLVYDLEASYARTKRERDALKARIETLRGVRPAPNKKES